MLPTVTFTSKHDKEVDSGSAKVDGLRSADELLRQEASRVVLSLLYQAVMVRESLTCNLHTHSVDRVTAGKFSSRMATAGRKESR